MTSFVDRRKKCSAVSASAERAYIRRKTNDSELPPHFAGHYFEQTQRIMTYLYRLGGLQLASDFALPGWPGWPEVGSRQADINIRLGVVPEHLANAEVCLRTIEARRGEAILLRFPGLMRVLVRDAEAVVDPVPQADPDMIACCLLGKVQAALWYRRGLLPLHGSALAVGGRAVVILGESGAGKSTLAATLASRIGGMVVSDDTCVVHVRDGGGAEVWPNTSMSRLWPDAVRALGKTPEDLPRAPGFKDKLFMGNKDEVTASPLPLALMVALEIDEGGTHPNLRLFKPPQAVVATFFNLQKPLVGKALRSESHLLAQAASLCRGVPMVQVRRPLVAKGDRTDLAVLVEQAIAEAMMLPAF